MTTTERLLNGLSREIIAGNDSETVLILASLNLDKKPDPYEVKYYLSVYMRQRRYFHAQS